MSQMAAKNRSILSSIIKTTIFFISLLCLSIGINLLASSSMPEYAADGTSNVLVVAGNIITPLAAVPLFLLVVLYLVEFFKRKTIARQESGKPSPRISGLILRTIGISFCVLVIMGLSFAFLAPFARSAIISEAKLENQKLFNARIADIENNPLEYLQKNYQSMTEAEITKKLNDATFSRLDFGTDATSNKTSKTQRGLFSENVYARTSDVVVLNKAKLSPDKHFVIFYTDTGDDKISDSQADELGEMAESIIRSYKSKLGLDYSYKKTNSRSENLNKIQDVLRASGIDENILDTAMPIYVAEPFSDSSDPTIAFYVDDSFNDGLQKFATTLFGTLDVDENAKIVVSTPTLPFVVIRPNYVTSSNLYVVTSHEIGHHYASLACTEQGLDCSLNNFIDETLPNYFAANVTPNSNQPAGNTINAHHEIYVEYGTCYKIDTALPEPNGDTCHKQGSMDGYPTYAFLQNYADVVPNAVDKMLTSLTVEDALTYLYEQTTPDDFAKVMTRLSQKNLTNDYEQKSLVSSVTPHGESLPCEFCTNSYNVKPAAMRYFYLPKESFAGYNIQIASKKDLVISVLGQKANGKYEVIGEQKNRLDFNYSSDLDYQQIAIAVVNTSISEEQTFIMQLQPVSEVALRLQEIEDYLNGLDIKVSSDCVEGSVADMLDGAGEIFNLVEAALSGDTSGTSGFKEDSAKLKSGFAGRTLRVCQRELRDTSFADAKEFIKKILPDSFAIMEKDNMSGTYFSYNIFTGRVDGMTATKLDSDIMIDWFTIK